MVRNKALIFVEVPKSYPVAGQHLKVISGEFDETAVPPADGFTARVLFASFDPYLRHRMIRAEDEEAFPAFELNAPISNVVIVKVLQPGHGSVVGAGDILVGQAAIQEYVTISAEEARDFQKIQNPYGLDLKYFTGALGMPGLTAYSAFYDIGKPKKGEAIFITAACGAVGQIVGLLAKREGLNVIGSVGSDDKLEILTKDLGFGGFNYRRSNAAQELRRLAPKGIDIYYDNVGGEQLEAAIDALRPYGRIIACGYASQYSIPRDQQYGIRNTGLVVGKQIVWRGFNIMESDYRERYAKKHQQNVQEWIREGSFKPIMTVTKGIENAPHGLVQLLEGKNMGKAVLDLGSE